MNLINITNLTKIYHTPTKEIKALDDISLNIEENKIISIIGPSGCGKSTLLNLITKTELPSEGSIRNNRKLTIGYMMQSDALLPWLTVYENACLGLDLKDIKDTDTLEYVNNLLKKYHLYEFKDKYPTQLSGGMRQRAALIRTLAIKPKILLLDEAFSALDYQTRIMVTKDVYSILRQEGITSLIVTHDISEGRFQNRHCENA